MSQPLVWVSVSRKALTHNFHGFRRVVGADVPLMPMIKSNAYGHDAILVARTLVREQGLWGFGVASLDEAIALRKAGIQKKLLVVSFWPIDSAMVAEAIRARIRLSVYTHAQLRLLERVAARLRKHAAVHIKLDTGTSRIGVPARETRLFLRLIQQSRHITVEGVFSHLAEAESADQRWTQHQCSVLSDGLEYAEHVLQKKLMAHIACTAALLLHPASRLSIGRLGIGLYGLWPSMAAKKRGDGLRPPLRLLPALTWHARLLQVKRVPSGTWVGYARTFRARRPTVLGVVPVGYWDGLDRRLSNNGAVLVRGLQCPIVGRISMNLTMIDVTAVSSVQEGEEVILLGTQGRSTIPAESLANAIGTIHYEVITRINPLIARVPR